MTSQKIIQQGAEANIILSNDIKRDSNLKEGLIKGNLVPFIIKDRISKNYRIKELDTKIRARRTRSEAKLLEKASQIISSPKPFFQPSIKNSTKLKMPFIQGKKLSEHLDNFSLDKQKQICKQIGQSIAKLHNSDIIHGDLTTSNMIFVEKENKVFFIDFGLGFISHKVEDRAVDLHLLKQALEAKHFKHQKELFERVVKGYENYKESKIVLERLKTVEKRGRYKAK